MTAILPDSAGHRPSRGDRGALRVFIVAGIAPTIVTAVFAGIRIAELLGNEPAPVDVELGALPAQVGSGAAALSINVESATVQATDLSPAALTWGITGPVLATLIAAALTVALVMLAASLMRGQIFSRRNTRLVITAGLTGLVGFTVSTVFVIGDRLQRDTEGLV